MINLIFNQIIPDILFLIIAISFCFLVYYIKNYVNIQKELINKQKAELDNVLEKTNYETDKTKAIEIINAIEQMGKEFDWEGIAKHSRATELINQNTNLNTEDIFNIIKATVNEINKNKQ